MTPALDNVSSSDKGAGFIDSEMSDLNLTPIWQEWQARPPLQCENRQMMPEVVTKQISLPHNHCIHLHTCIHLFLGQASQADMGVWIHDPRIDNQDNLAVGVVLSSAGFRVIYRHEFRQSVSPQLSYAKFLDPMLLGDWFYYWLK